MESKTWLAVIICCAIWFGYLQWFAPPSMKGQPQTQTNSVSTNTSSSTTAPVAEIKETAFDPISSLVLGTIKTERQNLEFSKLGGKISLAQLLRYHTKVEKDSPSISPVSSPTFSLGHYFTDDKLKKLGQGTFEGKIENQKATFSKTEGGLTLTKNFEVVPDSYLIQSSITLTGPAGEYGYLYIPVGGENLEIDPKEPLKSWEVVAFQNEKVTRKPVGSLKDPETVLQGNTEWVAFGNRYFSTVVINQASINPDVVMFHKGTSVGGYLRYPLRIRENEKNITLNHAYYIGSKDLKELSKLKNLNKLIDYGTFAVFALPLVRVLKFFHSLIPNYGVAIILLTLFVRLLFYPLQAKSVKSMKAMQKLQPQIAALKEKHKDDMTRFNQEQMALFKAHKVNPMGGCLPILVQLPVLFALYSVIGNSIELFHAPFFGWIKDLSTKDPYYIYPVLMGGAMFLQQKMTPSSASMDPAQQKMMLFMPLIFSFMMVGLPSGLTMYIFVSTLLGVLQQVMTKDKTAQVVAAPSSRPVS